MTLLEQIAIGRSQTEFREELARHGEPKGSQDYLTRTVYFNGQAHTVDGGSRNFPAKDED